MINKVLIATDGSEHAAKAVAFGADIASKYGAEVLLVHVLLRGELTENLRHMAEVEHLVELLRNNEKRAEKKLDSKK